CWRPNNSRTFSKRISGCWLLGHIQAASQEETHSFLIWCCKRAERLQDSLLDLLKRLGCRWQRGDSWARSKKFSSSKKISCLTTCCRWAPTCILPQCKWCWRPCQRCFYETKLLQLCWGGEPRPERWAAPQGCQTANKPPRQAVSPL
ncbi:hypothetical protein CSUI_005263, partial [Cystoisospora suis]